MELDSLGTMKHDCEQIQKLISKRHLAKQTLEHDTEIREHLDTCPTCRNYVKWLDHDHKELINYADSLDQFVDDFKTKVSQETQNGHSQSNPGRHIIAIVALVILLLGLSIGLIQEFTQSQTDPGIAAEPQSRSHSLQISQRERRRLVRTLQKAKQLRAGHDINGLITLLGSDLAQVRHMAAIYLGQIGNEQALPALEELVRTQDPNQTQNPFTEAIAQIRARKDRKTDPIPVSSATDTPLPTESNELAPELMHASSGDSNDIHGSHATADPIAVDANTPLSPLTLDALGEPRILYPGGIGYSVKGQLMIPSNNGSVVGAFRPLIVSIHTRDQLNESLSPSDFDQMSLEQIKRWCQDKLAIKAPPQIQHVLTPNAAGEFELGILEPGAYAIMGKLRTHDDPETNLGRFWHEFEIPDVTELDSVDLAIDLGIIPFIPGDLIIGDGAPFYSLPLLDGGITSLADQGNITLLTFYDIEDVPKHASSFDTLRIIYERFSESDSYTQLALVSSQRHPLVVFKQTELLDLPWAHAFVGEARQNRQYIEYDLPEKGPWNVLVDANGHIAGIGLDSKALVEALEYLLLNQ
jgi:hypothetical protein